MEISAHFYTAITDGIEDILKIVHREFLGDHVDDLVSGGNISFILIGHQLVDFSLGNLIFRVLPHDITRVSAGF